MDRARTGRLGRQWSGWLIAATLVGLSAASRAAEDFPEPLPAETTRSVATLATPYPASYAMVHDFGFGSLIDSAFSLVDTGDGLFKGMLSAGNFATFAVSTHRLCRFPTNAAAAARTHGGRGNSGSQ